MYGAWGSAQDGGDDTALGNGKASYASGAFEGDGMYGEQQSMGAGNLDDMGADSDGGDDDDPNTKRNLSQRERNREAVRNCRKRKREHTKQLRDRIEQLMEENAKLRLELQLGGDQKPSMQQLGSDDEQELIQEMLELVRIAREEEAAEGEEERQARRNAVNGAPPRSDTEMALRRKIQVYMERHQDHGRDRQKAIAFILGRLQRLVEPENITKQYLQIMTAEGGLDLQSEEWRGLGEELQLSTAQMGEFAMRRRYAKRLRTELDCAFEKMRSIVQRCRRNKKVGDSLNELTTILRPEQFARFVVWVHSNPACKDILDELWDKLLAKCDVQINREIQSNPTAVAQIKRFQQNSAALAMRLFSIADPHAREAIAKLCVHPDVVLVDANNNVDKRGIKAVTRYMSYVTHAFDTQSCDRTKSLRSLNVEERTIDSDPEDDKVTGAWRLSGVYIGRLRPRKSSAHPGIDSPAAPFGFGSASMTEPSDEFTLPSSVTAQQMSAVATFSEATLARARAAAAAAGKSGNMAAPGGGLQAGAGSPSSFPSPTGSQGAPEPLLSKEEQRERTVTFNVMVEFSFADPQRRDMISEMVISWDALSLVNQLGLLRSPAKGVLPPPNMDVPHQPLGPSVVAVAQAQAEASARAVAKAASERPAVSPSLPAAPPAPEVAEPAADTAEGAAGDAEVSALGLAASGGPPVSRRGRENAINLAQLFQAKDASERESLANEILDVRCTFDDIHMGTKYKGIPNCLTYIKRLRRAFPTFDITARVLSETKVVPERFPRRSRSASNGSHPSDGSSVASTPLSPRLGLGAPSPDLFEIKWEVTGFYGGALVKEPRQCQINGKVFVTTNPANSKIMDAKLDVSAQNLMEQIGLLREI